MNEYDRRLIAECTAQHPNHRCDGVMSDGSVMFWTVWCSVCEEKGYNRDGNHNRVNPDMDPSYVMECEQTAKEDRAQRQARYHGRQKLTRCACPTCGARHIQGRHA